MKKTLLTMAMMLGGLLSTQAQGSQKLTLDDNEDLVPVINAAAEAGGTYNITFSSRDIILDNWDVLCLPFDFRPVDLKNYLGTYVICQLNESKDDGNIHFEPTVSGIIPAGTPFIINVGKMKRTPTNYKYVTFKDVTLKKVESSVTKTDASGNKFISTFSPVDLYGSNILYISQSEWYEAEDTVALKPMRCYIDYSDNTMTELPQIYIGDPTGIIAVLDVKSFNEGKFATKPGEDNAWYTLTGTRLLASPNTKGIYIRNNRKVVIK